MSAMQFVIYQDSGGLYHWRLDSEGVSIAVSAMSFGSKEQARVAAVEVHMHAGGAPGVAG
jgi:uncharacterized protein YegP (UPF0339 family)